MLLQQSYLTLSLIYHHSQKLYSDQKWTNFICLLSSNMRDFQIKLIKDRLARETCIYLHTEGYKNLTNDEYNMY